MPWAQDSNPESIPVKVPLNLSQIDTKNNIYINPHSIIEPIEWPQEYADRIFRTLEINMRWLSISWHVPNTVVEWIKKVIQEKLNVASTLRAIVERVVIWREVEVSEIKKYAEILLKEIEKTSIAEILESNTSTVVAKSRSIIGLIESWVNMEEIIDVARRYASNATILKAANSNRLIWAHRVDFQTRVKDIISWRRQVKKSK
jgi:hypothetical protein